MADVYPSVTGKDGVVTITLDMDGGWWLLDLIPVKDGFRDILYRALRKAEPEDGEKHGD